MGELLREIGVVLLFVVLGGCFNAAEISMISLRDSQVRHLAETRGARGRRLAKLTADPNRLLAAVQIGVLGVGSLIAAIPAGIVLPPTPRLWASLLYMAFVSGALAMWAQT